ncbi:hypothetical protein [Botrimarina mediterranea]|uniref:hypothetical protein n=1 Tax=Botrimarina mediterranea TaxID=2528022 RepID=UPI0011A93DB6
MIELKIAAGVAIASALLATSPASDPIGGYTQLGLAGFALGILFYIVSKRDPTVAKEHADAIRELAQVNAEAMRDSARLNAEAIGTLGKALDEHANRSHDLLAQALKCTPPKD